MAKFSNQVDHDEQVGSCNNWQVGLVRQLHNLLDRQRYLVGGARSPLLKYQRGKRPARTGRPSSRKRVICGGQGEPAE